MIDKKKYNDIITTSKDLNYLRHLENLKAVIMEGFSEKYYVHQIEKLEPIRNKINKAILNIRNSKDISDFKKKETIQEIRDETEIALIRKQIRNCKIILEIY